MTTTTVINGQSIGTGSDIGNEKFSISPVTLGASTTAYVVNVKIVFGTKEDQSVEVEVRYTTTFESTTAADAPAQLGQTSRYVAVKPPISGLTVKKDSSLEPVTGGFFNCWVVAPKMPSGTAATLTVTLIEI